MTNCITSRMTYRIVRRLKPALLAGALAVGALAASPAAAQQEVLLQNDSLVDGDSGAICICFAEGEEVAVWLTSPCDGNIVAIQILWRSELGGAPQMLEDALLVYSAGNYPFPGALKEEFLAPLLTDFGQGFNEFRYKDENLTVPISVPVIAGETFVVSLAFFNANNGDFFAPSVVSDRDGATAGRNAVYAIPGGWRSNESLGVNGDWAIRAIVECGASATGACCLPNGLCDQLTEAECAAVSGSWNGVGTDCAETACIGACYVPSTGSCLLFDKATCDAVAGEWAGPGTTECAPTCPADLNGDGIADNGDIQTFVTLFLAQSLAADFNGDGILDNGDIQAFITVFLAGC
ncbi:MAG: hypothetical protein ACI89L_002135 [Phycisphaerales bacterium]|jgi:hypothetical protein